jgi:hypothetical protein
MPGSSARRCLFPVSLLFSFRSLNSWSSCSDSGGGLPLSWPPGCGNVGAAKSSFVAVCSVVNHPLGNVIEPAARRLAGRDFRTSSRPVLPHAVSWPFPPGDFHVFSQAAANGGARAAAVETLNHCLTVSCFTACIGVSKRFVQAVVPPLAAESVLFASHLHEFLGL